MRIRAEVEIAAGLADTRQRLARLLRLRRGTVEGRERKPFILASAAELFANHLRPATAAKMLERWNRRHCRPPLRRSLVSGLAALAAHVAGRSVQ